MVIFNYCRQHTISLDVQWIPREENQVADGISRIIDFDDWGISLEFFRYVDSIFGPHTIDRFADNLNTKLSVFNSRFWCPGTSSVDAFSCSWDSENNWLVPPLSLVCRTVSHLKASKASGTLIIPAWKSASFWPFLFSEYSVNKNIIFDVIQINTVRGVFVHGRNSRSLFGSDILTGSVMIVRLDARVKSG